MGNPLTVRKIPGCPLDSTFLTHMVLPCSLLPAIAKWELIWNPSARNSPGRRSPSATFPHRNSRNCAPCRWQSGLRDFFSAGLARKPTSKREVWVCNCLWTVSACHSRQVSRRYSRAQTRSDGACDPLIPRRILLRQLLGKAGTGGRAIGIGLPKDTISRRISIRIEALRSGNCG